MSLLRRTPQAEVHRFLNSPRDRSIDFGHITSDVAAAVRQSPGPIRLQQGVSGPKGFGNLHVEDHAPRMMQLKNLGFESFRAFVDFVCCDFTKVGEGGPSQLARLALIRPYREYDLQIIIQWNSNNYWSVVTGLPYRVARSRILYVVPRTSGSEPSLKPAVTPRFETLTLPVIKKTGDNGS